MAQVGGVDIPQPVAPYFNGVFPASPPGEANGWATENAFPNLTFVDPMWMTEIPGRNEFLLVGRNGRLWRFPKDPAATLAQVVEVLNWNSNTHTTGDDLGFYRLAFHPQFGQPGSPNTNYAYVCYSHKPSLNGANDERSYWRVSRFTWQPATGTFDPASENILIDQYDPHSWHNGGSMFFGSDGFLYVTIGDPGRSNDYYGASQRIDNGLFSGILRIDVDNDPLKSHQIRRQPQSDPDKPADWPPSFTKGYGIPNDNPWLAPNGTILEEFYAVGLRSPHAAHFDPPTGEIWVGDVGDTKREELDRIFKGSNAQWAYREGTLTGPKARPANLIGTDMPPVYDYDRTVGQCIIGGMRYRGAKWAASLGGKVLFGDHIRGKIWTLTLGSAGSPPVVEEIIGNFHVGSFDSDAGLANFCTDSNGEVYLMDLNGHNLPGGTIQKLVPAGISANPPQFLSQTGVFANLSTLEPSTGVIPYDVANPLWSDGAEKKRWIIVPNNGSHDTPSEDIVFSENGNWQFPPGTVFVKHFEMPLDERFPNLTRRLETRFIICTADGGKYGITYRWNSSGTDAELIATGESVDYQVTVTDGTQVIRRWDFPSRSDCMFCHSTAAGQALGVRTHQLNRTFTYPSTGRTANQLTTFNTLGMFDRTLTTAELSNLLQSRPLTDTTAPLEHRVRSYLDSNCAHCHQPGGTAEFFDARLTTPLALQGLIDSVIRGKYDLGPDGRYIKPARPDLSAVHVRAAAVDNGAAMPPLVKHLVDAKAIALLQQYITRLDPAEFEISPSPQARYVRLKAVSESLGRPWASVRELSILDGSGVPIPRSVQSIHSFSSEELIDEYAPAIYAIDGNPSTYWHTEWGSNEPYYPHYITIDLGSVRLIGGFIYYPQTDPSSGRIKGYEMYYSRDAVNWTLMTSGTWVNYTDIFRFDGLVGRRNVRCQIAGPATTNGSGYDVTVVFDSEVTGFSTADFQISGGTVTALRGKGYYYVATITPIAPIVSISIMPNSVSDNQGDGNRSSNVITIGQRTPYQQWAVEHGVDESAETQFADEDHDGVTKWLEYAFNLDPSRPDAIVYDPVTSPNKGLPRVMVDYQLGEPRLSLQYLRRKDGQGANYIPQFGSTLTDFINATGTPIIESLSSTWERVTIPDNVRGQPNRFGRLQVIGAQ
ncbi:discoidin domain-containing protein [Verrucomicrobiota bacterium sgz303538]